MLTRLEKLKWRTVVEKGESDEVVEAKNKIVEMNRLTGSKKRRIPDEDEAVRSMVITRMKRKSC